MSDTNNDLNMSTTGNEAQDMTLFNGSQMDCRTGERNASSEIVNEPNSLLNGPNEFEPFSKYYMGDWSSVEHLFKIVMNHDVRENENLEHPIEFAIQNNPNTEEPPEENIHELIMAFDNVILAQPNPPSPKLEDLTYIDFEIYPFTGFNIPGGQDRMFEKMQE